MTASASSTDRERLQLRLRTGIRDELVLDAAGRMESVIESGGAISAIARHLGVSMGRLERAFRAELNLSPADFYRQMRMQRARDLLEHSDHVGARSGARLRLCEFFLLRAGLPADLSRDAEEGAEALAAHLPMKAAQRRCRR